MVLPGESLMPGDRYLAPIGVNMCTMVEPINQSINQSINQKRIRVTKVTNVTARPL